ncbi:hypothetical protein [Sabulicella rubraurantiaca]|uniref:hypothetical protein n=1 Tax=Sabulicella rubraurantiaca TaxID=2811429 RepID=UPI001A957677|nr:hypothetical protein [Sabulicella rubraurantiaca]
MRQSIPLVDGGSLVGVVAQGDLGWFVIALDTRIEELDRANFSDAATAERVVRAYMFRQSPTRAAGHA